jgi:hypothetical protein
MTTPELDSPSPAGAAGARGPAMSPPAPRPAAPAPADRGVPWRDDGRRPAAPAAPAPGGPRVAAPEREGTAAAPEREGTAAAPAREGTAAAASRRSRRWVGWGRAGALVVALYAAAWVCDAGVRSLAASADADPLVSLGGGARSGRWDLAFWVAQHAAGSGLWRRALAACGERDGAAYPNCATVRLASWWGPAPPPPPAGTAGPGGGER